MRDLNFGLVDTQRARHLARLATVALAAGSAGWLLAIVHLHRVEVLPTIYASAYAETGIAGLGLAVTLALIDSLWLVRDWWLKNRDEENVTEGADA